MNNFLKKKILITGATGFIGSQLTRKIVEEGICPNIIVRDKAMLRDLASIESKLKIYECDIENYTKLKKLIKQINPEIVFHLAATGVHTYSDISYEKIKAIIDSTIEGTVNLLYALQGTACELIINTGSCFEYGSATKPFEEQSKLSPSNIYGISKVSSTLIAHELARNFNISIMTLRPFTVYGPRADQRRFISTVIKNCLLGKEINIPKQPITRDFIYIDDIVRAYLMVLKSDRIENKLILNISTGVGTTLEQVAKTVKNLTASKSNIGKGKYPIRSGEVISLIGSNELAKKLLHWEPKYTLEEGLKVCISEFKENKGLLYLCKNNNK